MGGPPHLHCLLPTAYSRPAYSPRPTNINDRSFSDLEKLAHRVAGDFQAVTRVDGDDVALLGILVVADGDPDGDPHEVDIRVVDDLGVGRRERPGHAGDGPPVQ